MIRRPRRENRWGARPANGGFAPERFPAFTIELVDRAESEGPGNVSSTDYRLVVSDGDASVEIETTNRRGPDLFEFRGQTYTYQVHEGDDGISYTVFPVTVGPGGVWSKIPEQGTPLPWLPFELDGVRLDDGLLSAVRQADWPWFKRHKEKIVKATPEARTFMRSLKKATQRGLIRP